MPAKTDYSRKTKWKNGPYRGERSVGGNFVYADENLLDKHLFVHRVAPGGFDWGPNASDDKASQLAIALLAPLKGVDHAVEHYHLFAENFVRRELAEDTWEVKRQNYRSDQYVEAIDGRDYPENTPPAPKTFPISRMPTSSPSRTPRRSPLQRSTRRFCGSRGTVVRTFDG